MTDAAVFRASLPPIQSAVKLSDDGAARVQMDVPAIDAEQVYALLRIARQARENGRALIVVAREATADEMRAR